MLFSVKPNLQRRHFVPVYRPQDYAFDVEPKPEGGGGAVLVNDLQLEIGSDGEVLYAWGMCPHTTWSKTSDPAPTGRRASLRAQLPEGFAPGTSIRVNTERWPVAVNPATGWVRIGGTNSSDDSVEFADGMIACLASGFLVSLWIRPATLP